jgi:hypothetical protein
LRFDRAGRQAGALPVTDENRKVLGVLPYRDVVALRHRFVE